MKDTVTPVKITGATMGFGILLNFLLLKYTGLNHGGLALSFSLVGIANMTASLLLLRRKIGSIRGRSLLRTLVFSLLAAAGMGIVIAFLQEPWGRLLAFLNIGGFWLVFSNHRADRRRSLSTLFSVNFFGWRNWRLWQLVLRRKPEKTVRRLGRLYCLTHAVTGGMTAGRLGNPVAAFIGA